MHIFFKKKYSVGGGKILGVFFLSSSSKIRRRSVHYHRQVLMNSSHNEAFPLKVRLNVFKFKFVLAVSYLS